VTGPAGSAAEPPGQRPPGAGEPERPGADAAPPECAGSGAAALHAPVAHAAAEFSALSFASALAAFALAGAIDAGYGPLLGIVSTRFGVPLPKAGLLISIHFCGAFAGVAVLLAARRRVSGRLVAIASLGVLGAGCLVIASARAWSAVAAGVMVAGAGFGMTDFGLNDLVARTGHSGRAGRLAALNAAFGAGAVAGPALVELLGSAALRVGFACAAMIAGAAALGMRGLSAPAARPYGRAAGDVVPADPAAPSPPCPSTGSGRRPPRHGLPRPDTTERAAGYGWRTAAPFGLAYLSYVGCESGIAGWAPAYLSGLGHSAHLASTTTSAFWGALTAGRLCLIPLSRHASPRRIVLATAPALLACVALTAITAIAPVAFAAAGLAAAPIFPAGLAWAARCASSDQRAIAWALTWSMAGGVAGPGGIAAATAATSVEAVPAVLMALAAACCAGFLAVPAGRGQPAPAQRNRRRS